MPNSTKASSCTRCVAGSGSAATGPCAASFGEQQQETVRCLNLLTNLVVVWNTRYMQEVVAQLRHEGQAIAAEDLRFLSPARYRHINRLGRYSFLPDETGLLVGLRPLRPGP